MPELYFIRHGQTDYNLRGIVQGGGIDSDLNETGERQGRLFFEQYRDLGFDRVYCSGLKRTYQTIRRFEGIGHEIHRLDALNEMGWGVLEGAVASPEIRLEYRKLNERWSSGDLTYRIPEGESPESAWARTVPGLEQIIEETGEGRKALICTHGRLMRIILSQMLGYGMQHMNLFPHENTGLNLLVRQTNGRWLAERMNDLSHLA